ncbi:hypothetical protein FJV41_30955 [Myxococcus llanfairpwllgwyngyllgogerychwyrndrobwllllantysiliogogogochensis]|uniref:Lipoprotein n=2 Tax=Myxococcus llanfairpwllgwyngyllgogerychwyrndrobwllllantysiliogogogochensis TaxID=2590453 RepID=A0A540WSR3_9BACT|nr:hypothetical protein FJV41_30955 [Myxococcus llanfairpwllgwyngyllgogerychwyrndrobwllllantysiliogogogochensis]
MPHPARPRVVLPLALALGVLAGCAPTAVGPMVMRLGPGAAEQRILQAGIRSGPRLSAPIAGTQGVVSVDERFRGDDASFSTQQWGLAFDAAMTWPLTERLHLHTGIQGEMFLPLPVPGYGVYAGASYYLGSEQLGVAPSFALRGASDFGITSSKGGPGSMAGAEATCAFSFSPEPGVSVGLVPFVAVHTLASHGTSQGSLYYGGVVAARFTWRWLDTLELSGGFGRAKVGNSASWNVPIVGVRGGR